MKVLHTMNVKRDTYNKVQEFLEGKSAAGWGMSNLPQFFHVRIASESHRTQLISTQTDSLT